MVSLKASVIPFRSFVFLLAKEKLNKFNFFLKTGTLKLYFGPKKWMPQYSNIGNKLRNY
jgi:hypothetical protein